MLGWAGMLLYGLFMLCVEVVLTLYCYYTDEKVDQYHHGAAKVVPLLQGVAGVVLPLQGVIKDNEVYLHRCLL